MACRIGFALGIALALVLYSFWIVSCFVACGPIREP
jgi:hypothetical protein